MKQFRFPPSSCMPTTAFYGTDRRKAQRHAVNTRAFLKDRPLVPMETFDLSSFGIGIKTNLRAGQGRTIDLVLLDGSVTVKGVVRNETEMPGPYFRVGIEFLEPQRELEEVVLLMPGRQD